MRRTTCARCELEGVVTVLVAVGHWGVCPVHDPAFIESVTAVPKGYALVRLPGLTDRGIPT